MKKYRISKSKLYNLYWEQGLTLEEISKIIKCSLTTVFCKLNKFKIKTRGLVKNEKHKQKISNNHADVSGNKNPFFGKKHNITTKKILSKKARIWSKKHGSPFKGKHHTQEMKIKMSSDRL